MDSTTTWLIVLVALGNYAMRAGPMLWARGLNTEGRAFAALQTLGPMLIAALFAVSVMPDLGERAGLSAFLPELLGVAATASVYFWRGGLATPIAAGVCGYLTALLLLHLFAAGG